MAKIAWRPPETVATAGLVSVIIEPGNVTERMWLEALPDRTVEMALQEPYPMAAAEQACRVLGLALTERPYELGQFLVDGNWELQEWLSTSIWEESPPPAIVTENAPSAAGAIE